MLGFKPRWLWAGIAVRLAVAPFLLQWFHPDERQTLAFAHFQAHGRMHDFMESLLHMRNQTAPLVLSWMIRAIDAVGLDFPWAYMTMFHAVLGLWSWWGLCTLVAHARERGCRYSDALGWFFALFWLFPFIYSRQLLETMSLTPVLMAFVGISRAQPLRAGLWTGLAVILRYPGISWIPGLLMLCWYLQRKNSDRLRSAAVAVSGIAIAIALGGIADWHVFGKFLESAPAYFKFNFPGGPVSRMFGNDSLVVYYKMFEFAFSPWLAPLLFAAGALAIALQPHIALFILPYVAAHIITPHREPRFMLPLLPLMALAVALSADRHLQKIVIKSAFVRKTILAAAIFHVVLNFGLYPLNIWAQLESAQALLVRNYNYFERINRDVMITIYEPVDALLPANLRWAGPYCVWRGTSNTTSANHRILVISENEPAGCDKIPRTRVLPALKSNPLKRLLRTRTGTMYDCPQKTAKALCLQSE
ncbi:MAG: hypothetical protein A2583_10560 [Bdellovibrionales bacterium RIFOXYD1_FULL_53_11]|nr:MAG: hypothetical protein A2583_10560 [Bdellovibrionales bacterium RIFOXYD1_FULL_53_11]